MSWEEAGDLLEETLEVVARLVDGEEVDDLPEMPEMRLDGVPDPATAHRIGLLLADGAEALAELAARRAEVRQELAHIERLRQAATSYLRH
jgi:hypothetical protein